MRTNRITQIIALVLALLAAVVTERIIDYDLMSRVSRIDMVLSGTGPSELHFYYQRPPASRDFGKERFFKNTFVLDGKGRISTNIHDNLATLFLVGIKTEGQSVTLHKAIFKSHFASSVELGPDDLAAYFRPGGKHTGIEKTDDGLIITAVEDTAIIVSSKPITFSNHILQYGLAALVGIMLFFLALRFEPARVPSLAQLQVDTGDPAKVHSYELDGLRGLAALSVVADHTWGIFTGSGLSGVWIFFTLSGYLLAIPFVRRPDLVFDKGRLQNYFSRRLARIVPMYFATLFVYYIASGQVQRAVPHFLFVQGDGHFWTIPQEMLFYLILPIVMIGMALLVRLRYGVGLLILATVTLWLLFNVDALSIRIIGQPYNRPPYFGWFLLGVCVSYLLNGKSATGWIENYRPRLQKPIGAAALVILVGIFVLGSTTLVSEWVGYRVHPSLKFGPYFGLAAGFLVFAAVFARNSWYGSILRFKPLRYFGIIGYSAYLLHPLLLDVITKFSSQYLGFPLTESALFVSTTVLTGLVASFTYNLIERPFLAKSAPSMAGSRALREDANPS